MHESQDGPLQLIPRGWGSRTQWLNNAIEQEAPACNRVIGAGREQHEQGKHQAKHEALAMRDQRHRHGDRTASGNINQCAVATYTDKCRPGSPWVQPGTHIANGHGRITESNV
jgi:hypothetical protein